jgi:hypothetical protein
MKKIIIAIAFIAITVALFSCTKSSYSEEKYENFDFIQDTNGVVYKVIIIDTCLTLHGEPKFINNKIHANSLTKQFNYVIMPSDGKLMNNELHENKTNSRVK